MVRRQRRRVRAACEAGISVMPTWKLASHNAGDSCRFTSWATAAATRVFILFGATTRSTALSLRAAAVRQRRKPHARYRAFSIVAEDARSLKKQLGARAWTNIWTACAKYALVAYGRLHPLMNNFLSVRQRRQHPLLSQHRSGTARRDRFHIFAGKNETSARGILLDNSMNISDGDRTTTTTCRFCCGPGRHLVAPDNTPINTQHGLWLLRAPRPCLGTRGVQTQRYQSLWMLRHFFLGDCG